MEQRLTEIDIQAEAGPADSIVAELHSYGLSLPHRTYFSDDSLHWSGNLDEDSKKALYQEAALLSFNYNEHHLRSARAVASMERMDSLMERNRLLENARRRKQYSRLYRITDALIVGMKALCCTLGRSDPFLSREESRRHRNDTVHDAIEEHMIALEVWRCLCGVLDGPEKALRD